MNEENNEVAYSLGDISERARKWMIREFGSPNEMNEEDKEKFYIRLGLLTHFLSDHFSLK